MNMMKNTISCLIFDFDGVIADTDRARFYILRDILKEYGIDFSGHFSMKDLIGLSTDAFLRKNLKSLTSSQIQSIVQKKHRLHFTNLEEYVLPFPGIHETLRELHSGFDLVMVSANPYKNLMMLLNHLEIKQYFKWIFGREICENDNLEKTYFPIASKIQKKVSECVVIEDSEYGVNAAKRAGYYCIRFDPHNRFEPGPENDKAKNHFDLKKKIEKHAMH